MSAVLMRIKPWFKRLLFTALACSWLSGIAFYILNTWVRVIGDFGPEKHPAQFKVLLIHGFSAFIMLMLFGALFSNHVPLGWRSRRLRKIGITLLGFSGAQIITAYLLYYVANESIRDWAAYIHLFVGLVLPVLLVVHVFLGKNLKIKKLI